MKKILLITTAVLVVSCAHKSSKQADRNISSETHGATLETKELFGPVEGAAMKDLFIANMYDKKVKYRVEANLWTDMNKKNLTYNVRRSLKEAIKKTYASSAGEEFMQSLKKNLVSELIDNFVTTLRVFDVLDGDIRVDLHFIPMHDRVDDLTGELDSNGLANFRSTKPKLAKQLESLDSKSFTSEMYNFAPTVLSYSKEDTAYIGGILSIHLKLVSTSVRLKVPETFKNGVQGFVRYRRFFAHKETPKFNSSCGTLMANKTYDKALAVSTVDLYQDINLKTIPPKLAKIDIYPGQIVSAAEGAASIYAKLPATRETVGKTFALYNLTLDEKGEKKSTRHQIEKLGFNIINGKADLTASASEVKTSKLLGIKDAQSAMIERCEKDLISAIDFEEYFPKEVLQ